MTARQHTAARIGRLATDDVAQLYPPGVVVSNRLSPADVERCVELERVRSHTRTVSRLRSPCVAWPWPSALFNGMACDARDPSSCSCPNPMSSPFRQRFRFRRRPRVPPANWRGGTPHDANVSWISTNEMVSMPRTGVRRFPFHPSRSHPHGRVSHTPVPVCRWPRSFRHMAGKRTERDGEAVTGQGYHPRQSGRNMTLVVGLRSRRSRVYTRETCSDEP